MPSGATERAVRGTAAKDFILMPSDPSNNQPPSNKSRRKPAPAVGGGWIWLVVLVALGLFLMAPLSSSSAIPWSDFYFLVSNGQVKEIVQVGDRYEGQVKDYSKLSDELKKKVQ